MPPEIWLIFKDNPFILLGIFLAVPFLTLLGVVLTVTVQRIRDRGSQEVAVQTVAVSEKEADTHQFTAIIEGFKESLEAVSTRAKDAENAAKSAKEETAELAGRVKTLEDERHDAINHIVILEALIPYPPGPPPRPHWMRPV